VSLCSWLPIERSGFEAVHRFLLQLRDADAA
jgi:hypothetical protein